LSLRFVAMRRNVEELPMLVRLASEIGVGQVQVAYLTVAPGFEQDESLWHHQSLATRVFDEARVVAKERNIDLRLPPSFADAAYGGEAGCVLPWTQLYIDPSGSLRLCCNAWDDFPPLGDFSAVNFRRVWNNDRYVELRASMLRGRPVYARCHNCPALARDPSRKEMHFL
jgi:MoaA/NifB/PqqE/SkfB family radical SAM enzyme